MSMFFDYETRMNLFAKEAFYTLLLTFSAYLLFIGVCKHPNFASNKNGKIMKTILLKGLLREFIIACAIIILCALTGGADFCVMIFVLYLGYGLIETLVSVPKDKGSGILGKILESVVLIGAPLLFGAFIVTIVLSLNIIKISHCG